MSLKETIGFLIERHHSFIGRDYEALVIAILSSVEAELPEEENQTESDSEQKKLIIKGFNAYREAAIKKMREK